MDDRQLLEDAARAAGHTLRAVVQYEDESSWYGIIASGDEYSEDFDPLNDDGDALRLASKLKIDLIHDDPGANDAFVMAGSLDHVEDVDGEVSRPAAVRRAIVRAAAAIGRQKEAE